MKALLKHFGKTKFRCIDQQPLFINCIIPCEGNTFDRDSREKVKNRVEQIFQFEKRCKYKLKAYSALFKL